MSERTGREAIHARRVNHKNVVRVLDVLKLKEHYVLRMELVRGKDFSRVVHEEGVVPSEDAVGYGLQVAGALAHAHRQGVIHLDLKPHNLLLCEDATKVMVTDFGISASLARDWGKGRMPPAHPTSWRRSSSTARPRWGPGPTSGPWG